ncbi:capsular biosynthesis protein [Psychromonas sp. CNPT3]|uniref:capsular biosynthesis protein n=1 Tax=Psychromonas sp. CNPT3 TaxID=314282 RepID=UPI001E5A92AE|nr:capsular biosynthesis protein [Psychromonas sp. CNPT3]
MNHNILFLQGPLGPFFKKFARYASDQGHRTYKINFNGGDKYYAWADQQVDYIDTSEMWHAYLSEFIKARHIDMVMVYGDCRFYHSVARKVARELGVNFWAMEEGYLRAGFVTFEKNGCNANSPLFNNFKNLKSVKEQEIKSSLNVGATFSRRFWFATCYYIILHLSKNIFPHYLHHRPWTTIQEAMYWVKGFVQHGISKLTDPKRYKAFIKQYDQQFFLLPLQVEVDFQLREHSPFNSVEQVISEVLRSFSLYALPQQALLIKHHPQNRGFVNYGKLISKLVDELNLGDRVLYGHDFNLPDVYHHARGVVTVNSTVGMSALLHNLPTIVLGKAIYDITDITYPRTLAYFWQDDFSMDRILFSKFRTYLCHNSQQSGDFYKQSEGLIENLLAHCLNQKEDVTVFEYKHVELLIESEVTV